jgi:hypothetical protein
MNRRSKLVMWASLGAASAAALAGVGCELLVTFPADEIDSGIEDGFSSEATSTDAPIDGGGGMDGDAQTDVTQKDTSKDAPNISEDAPEGSEDALDSGGDSSSDAPVDASTDVPSDTPHDSPKDVRGQ